MHSATFTLLVLASALAVTASNPRQVHYDGAYGSSTVTASEPVEVRYNGVYGNSALSTLNTACSNGINGLTTKGYPTLGSLKNFPYVGASPTVEGWNSTQCGACYKINYKGKGIYVTAVDRSTPGFVLSTAVLNELTGGLAVELGVITASYEPADPASCKM